MVRFWLALALYVAIAGGARAELQSLFPRADGAPDTVTRASLFAPSGDQGYQFIPPTLRRVAQIRGFGPETQFTPGVQDALALVLLEDAGFRRFQAGELSQRRFMYNLARIWAGLPLPNGQSYYQGYAGNKATMTWAAFEGGMQQIWGG